ncbi:MAG: glycosyl transferase [Acidiferrobacteraceae bacterium]|nr:glycosyl transferase [Acidiferrobacteraceae bacterium]
MSKVSVIIPTYNRGEVVLRALRSVFAQDHAVDQVIVVDDGSTDDTIERVERNFPGVELIVQTNHGVSHARNRGIERARNEWLAFLDSDDEWLPGKITAQLAAIMSDGISRVCHSDEIWVRNGRRVNPMNKHRKYGGDIFLHCLPRCVMSPSSVVLHRSVVEELGGFDETLPVCEDYELWLRIACQTTVLYVPQKLLIKYGGHKDQLSRSSWGMDRYRIQALEKLLLSEVLSETQSQKAIAEMLRKIEIYVAGAGRRHRWQEVQRYAQKRAYYENSAAVSSGLEQPSEAPESRSCFW